MKKLQTRSLDDVETRKAISGTAVKAFIGIMDAWDASNEERYAILGGIPEDTYSEWTEGKGDTLTQDQLERIGHILGIHKSLCLLFSDDAGRIRWLKSPNHDETFHGKSPAQWSVAVSLTTVQFVTILMNCAVFNPELNFITHKSNTNFGSIGPAWKQIGMPIPIESSQNELL